MAMTDAASDNAPFRVTLFFGPDRPSDDATTVRCVFNVKKRSWKGGVQVSVDVSDAQVRRLGASCGFIEWTTSLQGIPDEERPLLLQRMEDVFIQILCARKLDLALASGLDQRSQVIPDEALVQELDRTIRAGATDVLASMREQLDLHDLPPPSV